jgi:predicted amidohydrolase
MKAGDLPVELERCAGANDPHSLVLRGGSCIIAPDGSFVVEPVFDKETIINAELDLSMIDRELMTLDVSGHYHRPDVFEFKLQNGQRETPE